MKKIISLVMSVMLASTISLPCYAETLSSDSNSNDLTIESAYNLLETDNTELSLLDKQIKYNEDHVSELIKNSENVKNKTSNIESENISLRKQELLDWKKAQYDLDNLKHDRSEKLYTLKIQLKKDFMDVFQVKENIENSTNNISILEDKIKNTKLQISLGQARDIDLKQIETQKDAETNNINAYKKQEEQDLLDIKQTLNMSLDKDINLSPFKTEFLGFNVENIDTRIAAAIDKNYDINKQKQDLDLTQLEYMIIMQYTKGPKTDSANSLELSVGEKKNSIEDAKTSLQTSLLNSYNNIKNLEDAVKVENLNLQIAETNLKITQSNVEAGKATSLQEKSDKLSLAKEKTTLQKSINDYMNAVEDFKHQLNE